MKNCITIFLLCTFPGLLVSQQQPAVNNPPAEFSSEIEQIFKESELYWVEIEKPLGKTKVTERFDPHSHQFLFGEKAFAIDSVLIYLETVETAYFNEADKTLFIKLNDGAVNYYRGIDEQKLKHLDEHWEEHYSFNNIDLVKHPLLGREAPDFKAVTLYGKKIDLASLKGKVVYLNFWYLRCTLCYQEMPEINQLKQEFPEVEFISIMPENEGTIQERLTITENGNIRLPEPYNYYADSLQYDVIADGQSIIDKYHFVGYPINFFIDKEGRIRYVRRFTQWGVDESRFLLQLLSSE